MYLIHLYLFIDQFGKIKHSLKGGGDIWNMRDFWYTEKKISEHYNISIRKTQKCIKPKKEKFSSLVFTMPCLIGNNFWISSNVHATLDPIATKNKCCKERWALSELPLILDGRTDAHGRAQVIWKSSATFPTQLLLQRLIVALSNFPLCRKSPIWASQKPADILE